MKREELDRRDALAVTLFRRNAERAGRGEDAFHLSDLRFFALQ